MSWYLKDDDRVKVFQGFDENANQQNLDLLKAWWTADERVVMSQAR
jgi:hypothetical protein